MSLSLFLGKNGCVTCSVIGCKDPGAAHDLLAPQDTPDPKPIEASAVPADVSHSIKGITMSGAAPATSEPGAGERAYTKWFEKWRVEEEPSPYERVHGAFIAGYAAFRKEAEERFVRFLQDESNAAWKSPKEHPTNVIDKLRNKWAADAARGGSDGEQRHDLRKQYDKVRTYNAELRKEVLEQRAKLNLWEKEDWETRYCKIVLELDETEEQMERMFPEEALRLVKKCVAVMDSCEEPMVTDVAAALGWLKELVARREGTWR